MNADKLFRRWAKRLHSLQRSLGKEYARCKRTGEEESIHRLRVLLRRLRVCLRLGSGILGKTKTKAFRDWSLRISDAVGPVRDLDVTLTLLRPLPGATGAAARLRRQRGELWRAARTQLKRPHKLPLGALKRPARRSPRRLARKLARTCEGDRAELLRARGHLDTANTEHWHELRRDLRRLRYLRELCLPLKQHAKDPLLRELIHLQELLGNAQNCVAALAALASDQGRDAPPLRARLEHQRQGWLRRAERALAAFQRNRPLAKLALEMANLEAK